MNTIEENINSAKVCMLTQQPSSTVTSVCIRYAPLYCKEEIFNKFGRQLVNLFCFSINIFGSCSEA